MSSSNTLLEATLLKKSQHLKQWRKRYICLYDDGILESYDSAGGLLRARFRVFGAKKHTGKPHAFQVTCEHCDATGKSMGNETHRIFATENDDGVNMWLRTVADVQETALAHRETCNLAGMSGARMAAKKRDVTAVNAAAPVDSEVAAPLLGAGAATADKDKFLFALPAGDAVGVCDVVSKMVLLGQGGVGKTSLLERVVHSRFDPACQTTIGVCFQRKIVPCADGIRLALDVWDVAGQENYRAMWQMYYKGAPVILVVYDVTERSSFTACRSYLGELRRETHADTVIMLVGNKIDLDGRSVTQDEADALAEEFSARSLFISAKSGAFVDDLLAEASNAMLVLYHALHPLHD